MIYVIRHATAQEPGEGADTDRRLTAKGRAEARHAGIALKKLGAIVEIILSSPATRARETADLIATELSPVPDVELRDLLYGAGGPREHLGLLEPYAGRSVVLVGHMPAVGQLVAAVAGADVTFRPSAVCCLELQGEAGRLVWHRSPAELSALAGL